jgi:hypothetical protein
MSNDVTVDVEEGISGECRVINQRENINRGMMEWIEGVGRSQRGRT